MTVTTQDQRDYAKQMADQLVDDCVPLSRRLAYGLACDADLAAAYERACVRRSEGVPEWADGWSKSGNGVCFWLRSSAKNNDGSVDAEDEPELWIHGDKAPDLRADLEGPVTLPIINL